MRNDLRTLAIGLFTGIIIASALLSVRTRGLITEQQCIAAMLR